MEVLKQFSKGMIATGVALLLPHTDTYLIDFTQFSGTQLSLIVIGLLLYAVYSFLKPVYQPKNKRYY